MLGATRMSARPATGPPMPLSSAASGDTALLKASGPSTRAPWIAPSCVRLATSAASVLDGMDSVAVSDAESSATLGSGLPSAWAVATAFRMMSSLASESGATFIAASVMKSTRSRPGTVMWKTWEARRSVRRPALRLSTARMMASEWTWPFIRAAASPPVASAAAVWQAPSSPSAATTRIWDTSHSISAAMAPMAEASPTRTGSMRPASAAWRALSMASGWPGPGDGQGIGPRPSALSRR